MGLSMANSEANGYTTHSVSAGLTPLSVHRSIDKPRRIPALKGKYRHAPFPSCFHRTPPRRLMAYGLQALYPPAQRAMVIPPFCPRSGQNLTFLRTHPYDLFFCPGTPSLYALAVSIRPAGQRPCGMGCTSGHAKPALASGQPRSRRCGPPVAGAVRHAPAAQHQRGPCPGAGRHD